MIDHSSNQLIIEAAKFNISIHNKFTLQMTYSDISFYSFVKLCSILLVVIRYKKFDRYKNKQTEHRITLKIHDPQLIESNMKQQKHAI